MTIIEKIYIKGIISKHRINNGWSSESISNLLFKMNRDKDLFKICARSVRGKHSYSSLLARLENGYKN